MRLLKGVKTGSEYRRRLLIAAAAAMLPAPAGWAEERPDGKLLGFLGGGEWTRAIVKLLGELGHVEGRNLRVITRDGNGMRGLMQAAPDLIARQPDVLAADGPAVVALAAFTTTIPIVCAGIPDPVGSGLAQSLAHPGRNVTGLSTGSTDTAGIMLGMLKQMRPKLRRMAVLHTEGIPVNVQMRAHAEAAKALGIEWLPTPIATSDDAERVLAPLAGEGAWMAPIAILGLGRMAVDIANKHRIATIGGFPGTLMWFTREFSDADRRVASIIDKIFKGAKPGDIPFELPDKPSFMVNKKTAKAIGVEFPPDILLRATQVIE